MRVVLASLVFAASFAACANAPQREEAAPPLVVPPLAVDAGAPVTKVEPRGDLPSPLAVPARDPRPAMRSPRGPAELRAEIANLEHEATASSLHALAEAYCELARVDRTSGARAKALVVFQDLVDKHPTYASLDEVLYFGGLENELSGDRNRARHWYYDLIKRLPDSPYVPYAYFAFGEFFFDEARGDSSRNALAEQAYKEVLKYPQTPLRAEAQTRLDDLKKR